MSFFIALKRGYYVTCYSLGLTSREWFPSTVREPFLSWYETFMGNQRIKAEKTAPLCFFGSFGRRRIIEHLLMLKKWPLRLDSSGKGLGKVCGRFQVQVPMRTKIYPSKKEKRKKEKTQVEQALKNSFLCSLQLWLKKFLNRASISLLDFVDCWDAVLREQCAFCYSFLFSVVLVPLYASYCFDVPFFLYMLLITFYLPIKKMSYFGIVDNNGENYLQSASSLSVVRIWAFWSSISALVFN